MNKLESAIREINHLKEQADDENRLNCLPALYKTVLTIWYILLTVSFDKYDIYGLLSMGIYPLVLFLLYEIPFKRCIRRIKVILPFLFLAGILNPFFDRTVIMDCGRLEITGGMLSFFTLLLKGFFTVLAGYLLIISTGIEKICGALRRIHIPSILVTMILLIYRYLFLLLEETNKVLQAYSLRAPLQKGIGIKAWGSLLGLLLLRSMDRAECVYESMCLRGFDGSGNSFPYAPDQKTEFKDHVWFFSWAAVMLVLRMFPVLSVVGNLFIAG